MLSCEIFSYDSYGIGLVSLGLEFFSGDYRETWRLGNQNGI